MIDDSKPNANASYINKLNKIKVINLIRSSKGISRADIAKKTRLSPPTVSRIVEDLIEEELVVEVGEGESKGGRRPTLLEFSGGNHYIIGIDLGTTNIYGVLTDLNAQIIAEKKVPTNVKLGFHKVMERTAKVIQDLEELLSKKKQKRIYGIGMAVAGLINRQRMIVEFSPDFHWHEVDVVGELRKWYDFPIVFDNVTRVMALGELCYGVGRNYKNFICVNVGYGIGAGIVVDGKPLYGFKGMAGEFGHITLDKESSIQCDCGNFGCLEALSSGNAIAKAAQREVQKGVSTMLREMSEGNVEAITAEMVAKAAKQGDALAWGVFETAMEYLGIGIAALINLFNPEIVVIGGGVTQAGDILFDKVRKVVKARALNKVAQEVEIVPATFGMKAAAMGAVSLILNRVLTFDLIHPSSSDYLH
ncbi:MAG: ROK family transcriptional regulator [Candidatus Aminicenantes bacterium]|nr:ROK family transcriptional regulator [Candidatus Aminicenantes bacterium]